METNTIQNNSLMQGTITFDPGCDHIYTYFGGLFADINTWEINDYVPRPSFRHDMIDYNNNHIRTYRFGDFIKVQDSADGTDDTKFFIIGRVLNGSKLIGIKIEGNRRTTRTMGIKHDLLCGHFLHNNSTFSAYVAQAYKIEVDHCTKLWNGSRATEFVPIPLFIDLNEGLSLNNHQGQTFPHNQDGVSTVSYPSSISFPQYEYATNATINF